jgi:hypothetical protein
VYEYIKVDMNMSSYLGTKVDKVSTLTPDVLNNMGILFNYTAGLNYYSYMTANGDYTITPLPRHELFNRTEGKWKIPEQIPAGWGSQHAQQDGEGAEGWWELNQPDYVPDQGWYNPYQ